MPNEQFCSHIMARTFDEIMMMSNRQTNDLQNTTKIGIWQAKCSDWILIQSTCIVQS